MNATVNGRFKFEVHRPDGTVNLPFGNKWVNNTVVNRGLDMMFSASQAVGAAVGNSQFGFLVPMTYCRLSETDNRSPVDPADESHAILQGQVVSTSSYIKSRQDLAQSEPVTTTTADFTVTGDSEPITIEVASTASMVVGLPLFITGAGYFIVGEILSATEFNAINYGATVPADTVVPSGATITTWYPEVVNSVDYDSDSNWVWATFQRTFVLAPTGVSRNFAGVGVSNSAAQLDPLFSRVVLPFTLTVLGTEELRIIYQLKIKLPKVAAAVLLDNGGFNASGSIKVVGALSTLFGGISSTGIATGALQNSIPHILRGNGVPSGSLLSNSSFPADGSPITPVYAGTSQADSAPTSVTVGSYANGNFHREHTLTWGANRPSSTQNDVRSFFLGSGTAPSHGIQWLMDANQTKDPNKNLSATFRIAWARP